MALAAQTVAWDGGEPKTLTSGARAHGLSQVHHTVGPRTTGRSPSPHRGWVFQGLTIVLVVLAGAGIERLRELGRAFLLMVRATGGGALAVGDDCTAVLWEWLV